ncbi:MAG: type II toxin-antitoxin system RelE/ParE family toxin [Myxococcales bacterium]|nr:type II toxin-antitoxin system RelE/ParE family toxin [Myxococcales bacterium]
MKFQLHPEARQELERARRYYRARDGEVARRFAREVLEVFERVARSPLQFPKHGLLAITTKTGPLFFDVYKAVLPRTFPYVVLFFVRANTAIVLAVAHGKRRPGYWIARTKEQHPTVRPKTAGKARGGGG